ncbi:uncharacterized protein [Musca autumnalis]|uniref:uncharacterized protein n=1 Tax=Musca autumnalis TaxID=221902 RepID=UPI003CEE40D1
MEDLSKRDIQMYCNKCRTCLQATDDLDSLEEMEPIQKVSYGQLLKEVTNIDVSSSTRDSDIIPKSICRICSGKLKLSHAFIKQVHMANEELQKFLKSNPSLDCLQETEIDINSCLEIKLENSEDVITVKEVTMITNDKGERTKHKSLDNNEMLSDTIETNDNRDDINTFNPEPPEDSLPKTESDVTEYKYDNDDELTSNTNDNDIGKQSPIPKPKRRKKKSLDEKGLLTAGDDDDIAVPCLQCNKIFNNSKELTRHLRNTHLPDDQKCACPLCGIKFTRSCNMYKHMRKLHDPESVKTLLPTKDKPFECDKCHRRYTQKRQLNCHIKEKHTKEHESSSQDTEKANFDHLKKKKSDIRPLCFVCGSSFSNKAHLIVHMTRHTGERPFKCDLCERAFPRISDLTSHRRIHTGEKPFKCKLCDKAFRVSTKLATHMRSHTNERPYKCKQCERSFKYSKDLNIHNRVHTGERPYLCTICGSTFTQSNSLKAHRMKLGHMEETNVITSQNMSLLEEIKDKCRACLKNQTKGLQPLSKLIPLVNGNDSKEITHTELLKEVTNIEIMPHYEPSMPQFICALCLKKLKSSHSFIKQVQEANEKCLVLIKEVETQVSELEIKEEPLEDVANENCDYIDIPVKTEPIDNPLSVIPLIPKESGSDAEDIKIEPNIMSTFNKDEEDNSSSHSSDDTDFSENENFEEGKCINSLEDDTEIARPCPQCDKIFNNTKMLKRHLRNTHVPEDQKSSCPLCGAKFSRAYNMYHHMRNQHGPESVKSILPPKEGAFKCDKCPRRYTQNKYLKRHVRLNHNDNEKTKHEIVKDPKGEGKKKSTAIRPLCSICGSSFGNKTQLTIHMRRHTGEMPFKCDLCDRAFPRNTELIYHQRIHTGEKPYKCTICEKSFRVSTKLTEHMRSHTNERPYKCKDCERSFKYSKDLNIHQRIHTGERPYCCNVCGSTFTQSNSLKAHRMRLGHQEEDAVDLANTSAREISTDMPEMISSWVSFWSGGGGVAGSNTDYSVSITMLFLDKITTHDLIIVMKLFLKRQDVVVAASNRSGLICGCEMNELILQNAYVNANHHK